MNELASTVARKAFANGRATPKPAKLPSPSPVPIVLVLSQDSSLRALVASNCQQPWRIEVKENLDSILEFAHRRNVRLVVFDDELLPAENADVVLNRVCSLANEVPMLYVAGTHSAEVEKGARCNGAVCYVSKPLEPAGLGNILTTWLKHLMDRDLCASRRLSPDGQLKRLSE